MPDLSKELANIKLPSPPAIAVRILEAVKKENTSSDELSKIITADPALTSKVLRAANSPIYAIPSKVNSIQRAITVIGFTALKNIALSFVIANEFKKDSDDSFDFVYFWKRSVTAAVSAELIAALVGKKSDDIFVTGLLQDIGIAIMYLSSPMDYIKVLNDKKSLQTKTIEAERKIFGLDHQKVGMEVLKYWGIPESIYGPVGFHHNGLTDTIQDSTSEILTLSDKFSSLYHKSYSRMKMKKVKSILRKRFGIESSKSKELLDLVGKHSVDIMSFFEIDPSEMQPLSEILYDAKEEIEKVNLSYEQLVRELKRTKSELEKANKKLNELAFRDGLTGLYNHRYFQEQLDKEVGRAFRYQRNLSLVIFDLDHFKKLNDTYGHLVGDRVLRETAKMTLQSVRTSDIVARYGGEEFAIIMPETEMKGVVVLAERVRKKIASIQFDIDGEGVSVTASFGVTVWEPGMAFAERADVIGAADNALYKSKAKGRNSTNFTALQVKKQLT